jgi:hypothetical protein
MNLKRGSGLPPADLKFETWTTLDVGGLSKEGLFDSLKAGGYLIGPWARGILTKEAFVPLAQTQRIDLFRVQVRELGFRQEPWTMQVFARIKELGYMLCPADTGPQLRLATPDQEPGDYYWLAMEPIHEGPSPRVFFLGRSDDGTRWLRGYAANPDFRWVLDAEFVFAAASA